MAHADEYLADLIDDIKHPGRLRKAAVNLASSAALIAAHFFGAGIVVEVIVAAAGLLGVYHTRND
jgi:hypothetical protein